MTRNLLYQDPSWVKQVVSTCLSFGLRMKSALVWAGVFGAEDLFAAGGHLLDDCRIFVREIAYLPDVHGKIVKLGVGSITKLHILILFDGLPFVGRYVYPVLVT